VEDVVLIAGTALMFLFGWFLMKRLDRFLDENQKRIEEAPEQQQPEQCVHLAGNISPDKLEETLSRFRSSHAHVEIVIYDSEQISFPDNESDWAQLKPSHPGAIISFKRGCENVQNKGSELPKEHILVCLSSSPSNERIRLATAAEVLGLGLRSAKPSFICFLGYGVIRCFVEGLRTDSLYLMPGVRVSQVLSGCLILLGVLLVGIIRRRQDIQV